MDLDEEFTEFRAEVRDWLAAHVPPALPSMDTAEGFAAHRAWEKELADARLSVVSWPAAYGGRDLPLLAWLVFEEEYHAAGAPGRVGQNGIFLLAPTLFEHGTAEQRDRLLPRMADGTDIWAQAWSEPEAGSDLAALRSVAVRTEGGWLLRGQKTWSSRATFADHGFGLFRTDLPGTEPSSMVRSSTERSSTESPGTGPSGIEPLGVQQSDAGQAGVGEPGAATSDIGTSDIGTLGASESGTLRGGPPSGGTPNFKSSRSLSWDRASIAGVVDKPGVRHGGAVDSSAMRRGEVDDSAARHREAGGSGTRHGGVDNSRAQRRESGARHRGLTYFLFSLRAPGVTVRPVPQLDGEAGFAEIFFDDVFVPDADVVGEVGAGWRVAMSTASNERGLTLRSPGRFVAAADRLVRLWRSGRDPAFTARVADAWIGARAYQLYTYGLVDQPMTGPASSMTKLFWSELDLALHETAMDLLGERAGPWTDGYLFALAGPIYAGTNEIQRDVVAQRLLGLPRADR